MKGRRISVSRAERTRIIMAAKSEREIRIAEWAKRPPGFELFFAPLRPVFPPNDFEMIRFAYFVSKYGHAGQKRDGGSRYFDHPKAAAWIYIHELKGRDLRMMVVLLLHDIREDCYLISAYRMSKNFGIDVTEDVTAMTKLPKGRETTREYLQRVIDQGPWAILAKLCDRLHNLRTLAACTPEKQREQIKETRTYHLPMLLPALMKHGGQWREYAQMLDLKLHEAIETQQPA